MTDTTPEEKLIAALREWYDAVGLYMAGSLGDDHEKLWSACSPYFIGKDAEK